MTDPPRLESPGEAEVRRGQLAIELATWLKMGSAPGGAPNLEQKRALQIVSTMVLRWVRRWSRVGNARGIK